MWFDLVPGEHLSVAVALQRMELQFPCAPEHRASFPLVFDPAGASASSPPAVSRA